MDIPDDEVARINPHPTSEVSPSGISRPQREKRKPSPNTTASSFEVCMENKFGIKKASAPVSRNVREGPPAPTWKFYPSEGKMEGACPIDVIDHDHELLVLRRRVKNRTNCWH
eukprot:GEMP01026346.1.p1 GENE.GEMP01026346.1~~GEMP01026346.1.p1  ORF type:complete len:113 (+),score=11.99 GEMP01026346.1:24-362(+)